MIAAVAAIALTTAACGKTVQPGQAGVKVKNLTGGVDSTALPPGWHNTGFGEEIETYPTTQRTYTYSGDEKMVFTDKTGLALSGDVAATMRAQAASTPAIYQKYRQDFEELQHGQIRNDIRAAIAAEGELLSVEQLLGGGRQVLLSRAFKRVRPLWAKEGIEISKLEWVGPIAFPGSITDAIRARTQADQQVFAAQAQVAVAEANARVQVAQAQGTADANRIRGEALKSNPQVLEELAIRRWNGQLPQVTSGATPFVTLK
jgi:regulator of protease activity HflC (stomatin/prohibitin superfamily)